MMNENVSGELESTKRELETAIKKLEKCERQNERLLSHNNDLTEQVNSLSDQLSRYKNAERNRVERAVQVDQDYLLSYCTESVANWGDVKNTEETKNEHTSSLSIADSIKATAEAALQQTGFVYEPTSGMYYDYNSGYYYDNERSLYYEPHSGTYYYFNETSQSYQIHSQVDVSQYFNNTSQTDGSTATAERTIVTKKPCPRHGNKQPKQDGNHGIETLTRGLHSLSINQVRKNIREMNAANYPPCIRVMVQSSDILPEGSLYIITYPGGTIGRDDDSHCLCIPDSSLEQNQAEIRYDDSAKTYQIWPTSAKSVAKLNDTSLSMTTAATISHSDLVTIATTKLLLHIHPGTETCDDCEPGQVQAKIRVAQPKEIVIISKQDKILEMRRAKKRLMKKYGLANAPYEAFDPSTIAGDYTDRAGDRRRYVGSDFPVQKSAPPASTIRPIPVENKGRKLLEKLGWSEGDSLGRTGSDGIIDPVSVSVRLDQRKGLGSRNNLVAAPDDVDLRSVQRSQRWINAQKRFEKLDQQGDSGNNKTSGDTQNRPWVQGPTQKSS